MGIILGIVSLFVSMVKLNNFLRKYNVLNIKTKIKLLDKLSKREKRSSLAQIFSLGKSTISDIKHIKETILSYVINQFCNI